jgi:hypothetical protein
MSPVNVSELFFEVTADAAGGYSAECLTENIFTQATRGRNSALT